MAERDPNFCQYCGACTKNDWKDKAFIFFAILYVVGSALAGAGGAISSALLYHLLTGS